MINKKLDFSTAPEFIQQFENDNIEDLKQLRFYDWPLWQIIKVPVFYQLLQIKNTQPTVDTQQNRVQQKVVNAFNEISNFLKIVLYSNKTGSILCVTHTADCLSKKEGKFYNTLFDYIISQKKVFPIKHWENTYLEKNPRYNKPQIKIQAAESFFSRISQSPIAAGQSVAKQFFHIWSKYASKKNVDISSATEEFIIQVCLSFYKSYRFWKFSLKRTGPSKIFSSEKMCSGMLAAANKLRIPFYEFQHGNIDKNYPPYVWNKGWKNIENIIKPDYLVLFGNVAKNIVLATGFFDSKGVVTIGYEKIESYRSRQVKDEGYIFFALQPLMNELNKLIVREVGKLAGNYKIAIKYHPLQAEQEIDEYNNLLKGCNVTVFDKNRNIYDCILESKVIVSHVSTVLEEALSLGKISITIATENLPQGIHSMTGNLYLSNAIIPAGISNLSELLDKIICENDLSEETNKILKQFQFEIYDSKYYSNVLKLVKDGMA